MSVVPINESAHTQRNEKSNSQSSLFFLNGILSLDMAMVKLIGFKITTDIQFDYHLRIQYGTNQL